MLTASGSRSALTLAGLIPLAGFQPDPFMTQQTILQKLYFNMVVDFLFLYYDYVKEHRNNSVFPD